MVLHFNIQSPLATHWREATCEEVDCEPYRTGWRIRFDTLPKDDQDYLVQYCAKTGRHFTRFTTDFDPDTQQFYNPPATFLVFEAGQACFRARHHRVPVGRPELYRTINDLSERTITHTSPQSWVDDCGEHVEKLADERKRG